MQLDEYFFKVTLIGRHNTGKTTLVRRICTPDAAATSALLTNTVPTVGVEFSSRVLQNVRPNTLVRLQLWDTAGAEKYAAVAAPVFRNSGGLIAVCDVTNADSLTDLIEKWLPKAFEHLPTLPLTSVLVICNKTDLVSGSSKTDAASSPAFTPVEATAALDKAGFKGALVMEGSALMGTNIEDAIALLCNRIMDKFVPTTTPGKSSAAEPTKKGANVPVAAKDDPSPAERSNGIQLPKESPQVDTPSNNSSVTSPAAASSTVAPSSPMGNKADLSSSTGGKPSDANKKKNCPC